MNRPPSLSAHLDDRCVAFIEWGKGAGRECKRKAKWSVLTTTAELEVCGVHVRRWHDDDRTLAIEPKDDE